jgi:hypothetical protein
MCLVDQLLGGVGVVSLSVISAPSALDFSGVLGLDRLCCARVIVAPITWGRHDS